MTNLELTHLGAINLIGSGVLGAVRTLIAGSFCDIDRTMEKTFINFAKGSRTFVSSTLVMIYFHYCLINLSIFIRYQ